jgi:hypothetical protein
MTWVNKAGTVAWVLAIAFCLAVARGWWVVLGLGPGTVVLEGARQYIWAIVPYEGTADQHVQRWAKDCQDGDDA